MLKVLINVNGLSNYNVNKVSTHDFLLFSPLCIGFSNDLVRCSTNILFSLFALAILKYLNWWGLMPWLLVHKNTTSMHDGRQ